MKETYLKEDQDLLDELEKIRSMPLQSVSELQQRQIQEIQILSNLRHRKSFEDSSKSTDYFTKVLGAFAIIQIVIALFQLTFQVMDSNHKILAFFLFLIFVYLLYKMISNFDKFFK